MKDFLPQKQSNNISKPKETLEWNYQCTREEWSDLREYTHPTGALKIFRRTYGRVFGDKVDDDSLQFVGLNNSLIFYDDELIGRFAFSFDLKTVVRRRKEEESWYCLQTGQPLQAPPLDYNPEIEYCLSSIVKKFLYR